MLVYTARFLLPVAGPPVLDAAVAVDAGRVVRCGSRADVTDALPAAERRDFGNVALIPGLVNAHTHLELSWLAGKLPPAGDWVSWVRGLLETRTSEDPQKILAAARSEADRLVARGTVAVGDIGNRDEAAQVLAASRLEGIRFLEIYGFRDDDAQARFDSAVARLESDGARLRSVLTPHAPHTTSPALLRLLARRAAATGDPLSIHVAESEAECEFVRSGVGPFAELLRERGMAEERWTGCGCGPVEYLERQGLLTARTLAVHCTRIGDGDIPRLAVAGTTVVTCPRSNRALGVGRAPVPALLAGGVRVALGTDSLASAPSLDLFGEMAALRAEHPGIPPATVLRMATTDGAAALGIADRLGSVEPGKLARLTVVPLEPGCCDPTEAVTSGPKETHALEHAAWETAS